MSNVVTVNPAAAATYLVGPASNSQTAGVAFNFTVTAKDAFGNTATGYLGTAHFTSTDGQATAGTGLPGNYHFLVGDAGVKTFSATLKTSPSQTITGTDTSSGTITGTTASITVAPSSTTTLTVTAGLAQNAGTPFNVTVTAKDAFGNTATGYTGTVHITTTDGAATPPADNTLASGVGTFSVTLKTVGTFSVTGTDTVTGTINGTQSGIVVGPANAATFTVTTTAGGSQTAGATFNVTVTAKDGFGNTATGYLGTVHFTSTDGQVSAGSGLPSNYHFLIGDAGVHTFTSVLLKTVGSTQTITATDTVTGTLTGTSPSINVVPAATSVLVLSPQGSSQTAGVAFNVIVTAKDPFGNTTPLYAGTVHFISTDGQATSGAGLPTDTTLTSGTATLLSTLKTAGPQTITGTDTVAGTITGTSSSITVLAAGTSTFALTATTPEVAGTSFGLTVTAKDPFGNTTSGYGGTVHITSTVRREALHGDPEDDALPDPHGHGHVERHAARHLVVHHREPRGHHHLDRLSRGDHADGRDRLQPHHHRQGLIRQHDARLPGDGAFHLDGWSRFRGQRTAVQLHLHRARRGREDTQHHAQDRRLADHHRD